MSFLIKIKNADFSAIKVATIIPSTSITDGLQSYYRMVDTLNAARLNYKTNNYDGYVTGTPLVTSEAMLSNGSNHLIFGSRPSTGDETGDRTIAVILKGQSTGGAACWPVASYGGNPTVQGAEYFEMTDLSVKWVGTLFNGGTYDTSIAMSAMPMVMDRYDLLIVRLQSGVGGELLRPRDGASRIDTKTGGMVFPFPSNYGTSTINHTPYTSVSMFAHWNRCLTDTEVYKFYDEQRFNFSSLNI